MSTSTDQPLDLVVCPDCGASVVVGQKLCWLCSRTMEGVRSRSHVGGAAGDVASRGRAGDFTFALLMVLTVAALGLVCIGAGMNEPGVAIGIAVLATPALLAVLVGWLKARARGKPMGPLDVIARFALSFGVLMAGLAALSIAAFVAFFAFCIYMLSAGSW